MTALPTLSCSRDSVAAGASDGGLQTTGWLVLLFFSRQKTVFLFLTKLDVETVLLLRAVTLGVGCLHK